MDTDKAYIYGLLIGGGIWGEVEEVFRIKLPYNKWGSYEKNPRRVSTITQDIMKRLSPLFRTVYGLSLSYETNNSGNWTILCEGDTTELRQDLESYGIECIGELRTGVSLTPIVEALIDDNLKRRFVAGLADTIGSTAPSHRRFTDEVQILSFELKGFDFNFVCALCRLLHSIECIPDQILWNHPNFHCASNPYYKQWAKGFKIRVHLDQYSQFGAFAFKTKAEASIENLKKQHHKTSVERCPDKKISATRNCVHPAENDKRLPDYIRGIHFFHNRHVCAVLGCENAPYKQISDMLNRAEDLVTPFPILCKDLQENIENIISNTPLYANRAYKVEQVHIKHLYEIFTHDRKKLIFGTSSLNGYPIAKVIEGIAYLLAEGKDLHGTRVKGNYIDLVKKHIEGEGELTVEVRLPEILTPIIIIHNNKGVLIGADNPKVYKRLIERSEDNPYKIKVREITEKDLTNE